MALVARWMGVGFIHGVMNTDNMTISGETIDYGPCAFMDAHDPATVFSSIDQHGRYAYGNQPLLARWNLARLAETLLPLMADDPSSVLPQVQAAIEAAEGLYAEERRKVFAAKLGVPGADDALIDGFLAMLTAQGADFTQAFRHLGDAAQEDEAGLVAHLKSDPRLVDWLAVWRAGLTPAGVAGMARANPVYIARNHRVEEALAAAVAGDLAPLRRMLEVLADPFTWREGFEDLEGPGPQGDYVTYCGT